MTEVFIEGLKADATQGISSLLTLALDDLKDFGARNTSFSKTIVLPGTARNNKLFGSIFDVTSGNPYDETEPNININFNAAKKARCMIFQDSAQAFKGDIRMTGIVIDGGAVEYEVVVFGELYGLVTSIGRGRLQDLDFSDYDHTYSWANISASWANDNAGEGYYYPLIDYGGYSASKLHWAVGTFRPALFLREYLVKIFEAAGYTYTCALFDTDRFKRLIIPHNQKILNIFESGALEALKIADETVLDDFTNYALLSFDTVDSTVFTPSGGNTAFTYNQSNPQSFIFDFVLVGAYVSNGYTDFRVKIFKNATELFSKTFDANGTNETGANIDTITDATPINVSLVLNDVITVSVEANGSPISGTYFTVNEARLYGSASVPIQQPATLGDTIALNNQIPKNILQKDLLSSVMKLFNLYIYEDPDIERHVNIAPYVDFYDGTSINWTQKVDRSKPIQLTPMSQLTARFYDFKFKDDSDYYNDLYKKRYNETYGQYSFDSDFDFEDERLTVELAFSPTPLVGRSGEDKIFSSIMKIENLIESQVDSNIRLLQAKTVTGVTSWNVTGVVSGLTEYPYAGHYDDPDAPSNDIQFGVPKELFFTLLAGDVSTHQFNIYWSSYMAEITDKDSRLMRCKMRLLVSDIATLDFGKLIWIDGALWRLHKITDYNMSSPDLCEVQLLKVIEIVY
jgi:hypothetical protein